MSVSFLLKISISIISMYANELAEEYKTLYSKLLGILFALSGCVARLLFVFSEKSVKIILYY